MSHIMCFVGHFKYVLVFVALTFTVKSIAQKSKQDDAKFMADRIMLWQYLNSDNNKYKQKVGILCREPIANSTCLYDQAMLPYIEDKTDGAKKTKEALAAAHQFNLKNGNRTSELLYLLYWGFIDLENGDYYNAAEKSGKLLGYKDILPYVEKINTQWLAKIYASSGFFEKADGYYKIRFTQDKNSIENLFADGVFQDYTNFLIQKKDFLNAEIYATKLIDYWDTFENLQELGEAYYTYGKIYIDKALSNDSTVHSGMNANAIYYFNLSINVYKQIEDYAGLARSYTAMGNVHLLNHDRHNAELIYQSLKAIEGKSHKSDQIAIYSFYLNYSKLIKDSALENKVSEQLESLSKAQNPKILENEIKLLAALENIRNLENNQRLELLRLETKDDILYLFLVVSIVLLLILLTYVYLFYRMKVANKELKNSQQDLEGLLETTTANAKILEDTNAFLVRDKTVLENTLMQKMHQLNHTAKIIKLIEGQMVENEPNFSTNRVLRKFLDQEFWQENESNNRAVDETFHKLASLFPGFSDYEVQLCDLFSKRKSIKEIASQLAKTENSIRVSKSRLKTKLRLKKDEQLEDYLEKRIASAGQS